MRQPSLLQSGFWTTYGVTAARGLALVSNLVLARLLLPEDYGVIGVAYIFWAFANLFTQGTLDSFIVYRGLADQKALDTAHTVSWIIGGSLALGLLVAAPAIAHFFAIPALTGVLSLFSANLFLSFLYTFKAGILQRQMRYRDLAQMTLVASLGRLLVSTGAAVYGLGYWSFALGDLAYWLLSVLLVSLAVDAPLKLTLDPTARKAVLIYCLGAVGGSLGFYLNANFDSLLVGKLLGQEQLGYYNFAYQLTMAACIILTQATQQLGTSVFAQIEADGDRRQSLQQLTGQMAFLGAPLFSLLYLILNPSLIAMLFAPRWVPACRIIPWLLGFAYCRLLTSPLSAMLSATGKPNISAQANLIIAPIAILSFAIGALQLGILGVAVAAAIVLGGGWTLYWWWLGCRSFGWTVLPFLWPALQCGGGAIAAIALVQSLPLLLRPIAFSLLYLALSLWWAESYLRQWRCWGHSSFCYAKQLLTGHPNRKTHFEDPLKMPMQPNESTSDEILQPPAPAVGLDKLKSPAFRAAAQAFFELKRHYYQLRYPGLEMAEGTLIKGSISVKGSVQISIASGCRLGKAIEIFGSGSVTIGRNCSLNGCWIGCDSTITIANDCLISDCYLLDTDYHNLEPRLRHTPSGPKVTAPISIERNVWIGANATVMKGVTVGQDSVVGLGSVIRKSLPAGVVAIGNPQQIVRRFAPEQMTGAIPPRLTIPPE